MASKLTKPSVAAPHPCRLVLEANCSTCGPMYDSIHPAALIPELALKHTESTGHVVILNGTTDLPAIDSVSEPSN